MSVVLTLVALGQMMSGANTADTRFSTEKSREVMASFGRCIAKRKPVAARAFVLETTPTAEASIFGTPLASYCLPEGSAMRFQHASARGAMAEQLIAQEFAAIPDLKLDGVMLATTNRPVKVTSEGVDVPISSLPATTIVLLNEAVDPVLSLGECLWRNEQAAARALLLTKVNRPEETAAIKALVPTMQKCVAKGRKLQIDKSGVRAGVAIAYYRFAHAPKGEQK